MWTLVAMLLAQQSAATPPPPIVSIKGTEIYSDTERNVSVRFAETPFDTVLIGSRLPAGWTFGVDVDGDHNGVWGIGPEGLKAAPETSPDHSFGQDQRNGVFCSQYVFTSFPKDPNRIYAESECGGLPSNGRVMMTGFDKEMQATIMYEIPAAEFFDAAGSVRLQVCVWDTARWTCQHRMPDLLELKRTMNARRR